MNLRLRTGFFKGDALLLRGVEEFSQNNDQTTTKTTTNRRQNNGRNTTIQGFFKWLCRKYYITANPAADLELPKVEKRLPRQVLTAHEAEQCKSARGLGRN
jgi:site-specific recombinase XerD